MDSLITAAARALASGDALGALNYIALRDDPPALALRGVAMAQLGDLVRAKSLLRRAARAFGPRETVARARCVIAETEIALVSRDLDWPTKPLEFGATALERHGDRANAAHARYLAIRRLLLIGRLIGRLDQAERLVEDFDSAPLPTASRAAYELIVAGIAMRRFRIRNARAALARAETSPRERPASCRCWPKSKAAALVLDTPAARLIARGAERLLRLDDIETLLASKALVVDACRHVVCQSGKVISLETRPVLFALARALAEAWPGDCAAGRAARARVPRQTCRRIASRAAARRDWPPAQVAGRGRRHRRDQGRLCARAAPTPATSRCSRRRPMTRMRRCLPCWRTARHGRVRRSRWRSA